MHAAQKEKSDLFLITFLSTLQSLIISYQNEIRALGAKSYHCLKQYELMIRSSKFGDH